VGNGFEIVQIGADDYLINREAGAMVMYTSNTEAMRIDSSGRVGIGTNSPSSSLSAGGLHVVDRIAVGSGTVGTPALHYDSDTDTGLFFGTGVVGVSTGGSERMRIDSSGNLLVGTTDNNVSDNSGASNGGINIGTAGVKGVLSAAAGQTVAYLNRLDSDGDIAVFRKDGTTVGSIGVSSDYITLIGKDGNAGIGIQNDTFGDILYPASGPSGGGLDNSVDIGYSSGRFKDLYLSNQAYASYFGSYGDADTNIYFAGSDQIRFITGGSETMRIDSSGNLLVGKTGYGSVTGTGSQLGAGGVAIFTASSDAPLYLNRTTSDGIIVDIRKDDITVGSISVTSSATAYNTSSDYRLKEDVQPMVGASDRVLALNPVNFAWKADGSRVDGFLAHEAQSVVPEAVTGEKDAVDAEGNPEYQGIDQSKLVPLLTAALQEALQKIETLEARVAALEA
jgi:hypothetical protein